MEKAIHVNAYVKQDGTEVREHYRGIDSNEKTILYGNVEKTEKASEVIQSETQKASKELDNLLTLVQLKDDGTKIGDDDKIQECLDNLDDIVSEIKKQIDINIDNIVHVKDQDIYSQIYDHLQKNYSIYSDIKTLVYRAKVHSSYGNYSAISKETNNFLNDLNLPPKFEDAYTPQPENVFQNTLTNPYIDSPIQISPTMALPYYSNDLPQLQQPTWGDVALQQTSNLYNIIAERILAHEAAPLSTMYVFLNNKNESAKTGGHDDKFYHARANAQAGQYFDPYTAIMLSNAREFWDILRKNTWDKARDTTFKNVWDDSKRDMEADNYGLMQGMFHPFSNVDEILDREWLDNLNK